MRSGSPVLEKDGHLYPSPFAARKASPPNYRGNATRFLAISHSAWIVIAAAPTSASSRARRARRLNELATAGGYVRVE